MRLKRLEVRGFKSFADRTEFDFDADLTGIVGPNGCGKSNVVDALKWVLGDRSAKSLRGAEMIDVIFKGAEGRDGVHAAEVTIVLENDLPLSGELLAGDLDSGEQVSGDRASGELLAGDHESGASSATAAAEEMAADAAPAEAVVATASDPGAAGSSSESDQSRRDDDSPDETAEHGGEVDAEAGVGEANGVELSTEDGAASVERAVVIQPRRRVHSVLASCTEVRIGRRLNRDKESSYLINDEVVRLKDVRDLLMDTGLGVGAYSVMEQGRIDAVLSADPESRRAIFEEAAGVSRFKIQKRETLRKLDRTEQNLARVKDLLEERTRRIRGLKIQAGKARRFAELQSELRDLRAAVAAVDARLLRGRQTELAAQMDADSGELEVAEAGVEEAREQLAGIDERIAAAEATVAEAQERLREASTRREAATQRSSALDDRAHELREQADGAVSRERGLDEQRRGRREALTAARDRLTEVEGELVSAGKDSEARRDAVREAQSAVQELGAQREAARERILDLLHEKTRLRNQAHDRRATVRGLAASLKRLDTRATSLGDDWQIESFAARAARRAVRDLGGRDSWLAVQQEAAEAALTAADEQAGELSRLEAGLRERAASVRSRLETLRGMEAELDGLDAGPRHLLETQPKGLRGRLLDQIEADLEDSRALEAALGSYVQALVVETRDDATAMLRQLEAEGKGRALLLIAQEFGERLQGVSPFALPDGAEYLYRRVRCRRSAWPMVHWLLRGVCLVEDLDAAHPDRTDLCFVTKSGATVCGPRLEGGGEAVGGLLVRRAQIQSLEEELGGLESHLEAMQRERDAAHGRVADCERRVQRLRGAREVLRDRRQAARTNAARRSDRIAHIERELAGTRAETADLRRQRNRGMVLLGEELLGEVLLRRREAVAKQDEEQLQEALTTARQTADTAVTAEQELKVKQAGLRSEREAQSHRIEALEAGLADLDEALAELDQRREQALAGATEAEAEAKGLREEIAALEDEVATLEDERDERQQGLAAARDDRGRWQSAVREQEERREAVREQLGALRLQSAEVEHQFDRLEERLRGDVGVELRRILGEVHGHGLLPIWLPGFVQFGPAAPQQLADLQGGCLQGPPQPPARVLPELQLQRLWEQDDFDLEDCRKRAQQVQAHRDRLGTVHLDAVEELEDEERRLGTLEHDVDDLSQSRKSLMEALRRMEIESRGLFERTFEEARENFRSIFRKLFQGGRADMYLTESENALESGIEIVAKPPGKELQSIALLSGGERSLTALAILFAVFKVKPSPFCILDEVDAALDETNVERFLRVLQDFVGPSQFCIVTHHKRTMAACQVLYGITMQKRGVSSRISVKLDDVDEFTDAPSFRKSDQQRIAGEEKVGF